ncbi:MAG: cytochrome c oxidase accessory protein CcoG [Thiobacillus sp. 65-69]|nr:cytochrome c oxidase accessory protein CcoG [Thiobacillus sp.]ODU88095.1 MAG: cytochrome c oxidase accessory protein CcoG [Thiobacillus sp. SCN 65-179]OJW36343.1 MAG: cytochrome c oxidase accessory protein CcoG [Thiobacillus sp. 65-69]
MAATDDKQASNEAPIEQQLYAIRQTIQARAVHGVFANWRIALVLLTQALYYGLPWISWDNRQAVLFDLAARKFYIFGLVFWPQDFVYLTGLLILSALSLFLFTAVAGRLWCGYACPQTVYTEIFMWVENWFEGDHIARRKLDTSPWNAAKLKKRGLKHLVWFVIALWTGFTFVGYFTPVKTLAAEVASMGLGPWETFWILFYAFATWGNAGFMREQVCKYMCPYARFQSVMFDSDTLVISYDPGRGEPRGARSKKTDYKAAGLGACVDCGVCVQVCPTGIDIRNGLQYECIGCAACIDGCDQIMDKMGYPRGLIRYTTENAVKGKYSDQSIIRHILRPRTLIYTVLLGTIAAAFLYSLATRVPLRVDVVRDRVALSKETDDGLIENVYRLQIINKDNAPHRYTIGASGIPGLKVVSAGREIAAAPLETIDVPVSLVADPTDLKGRSIEVTVHIQAADDARIRDDVSTKFFNR